VILSVAYVGAGTKSIIGPVLINFLLAMGSEDMNEARLRFWALKITDYNDFVMKYDHPFSAEPSQVWEDIDKIGWFYNGKGFLCTDNLQTLN